MHCKLPRRWLHAMFMVFRANGCSSINHRDLSGRITSPSVTAVAAAHHTKRLLLWTGNSDDRHGR
ncbi:hypothetical protein GCK32_005850 [Trichostrongylus colubriformis]|uniref:Uncharacterized protein n=1 Tax=Trichostrongylus colubriformis TaxID=6319 RepID=A0AAN8J3H7_TRICO